MMNPDVSLSLHCATGLELPSATVERAIRRRMKDCAITRLDAYLDKFKQDPQELSALTELVLVPETWFFRDQAAFDTAVQVVQNLLAQENRPVSILSVPCATGEEPYSLSMALLDAGVAADTFNIEAIDISAHAIQLASHGTFGRNAFRTKDLRFRDRHFMGTEHGYAISKQVRDCVQFSQGNLLALDIPARANRYDIIFCRNLLIYFNEKTQQEAVRRLAAMLRNDGMLFSGYAEAPVFHHHGFVSTPNPKAFALKKASANKASSDTAPMARAPSIKTVSPRPAFSRLAGPMKVHPPEAPRLSPGSAVEIPNAETLLAEARTFADQGDYQLAGTRLAECLRYQPDLAEANLLFGLISERNGDFRTAEDYIRRAIYFDPHHYEALCHLAILAEKQGNIAGASAARQRAARVMQRQESKKHKGQ